MPLVHPGACVHVHAFPDQWQSSTLALLPAVQAPPSPEACPSVLLEPSLRWHGAAAPMCSRWQIAHLQVLQAVALRQLQVMQAGHAAQARQGLPRGHDHVVAAMHGKGMNSRQPCSHTYICVVQTLTKWTPCVQS